MEGNNSRHNEMVRGASAAVQEAARTLRREMTLAERVLWEALRGKRLDGIGFRRQHPVGKFVLDFYVPQYHLTVEVDGNIHDNQRERDSERSTILQSYGYHVLRFRNDDVLNRLPDVLEQIRKAVQQESRRGASSLPSPPDPSPPPSPVLGGGAGGGGLCAGDRGR